MKNGVFEFDKTSQEKSVIQTEKGVFVLENGKVFDVAEYHKNLIKEGINGLNYPDALLVQTHFEKLKRKNIVDFDDFLVQTKLIKSLIALGKYNVANESMKGKILEFIVEQYNDVVGIFEQKHSPYRFEVLQGKEGYGEVRERVLGNLEWYKI